MRSHLIIIAVCFRGFKKYLLSKFSRWTKPMDLRYICSQSALFTRTLNSYNTLYRLQYLHTSTVVQLYLYVCARTRKRKWLFLVERKTGSFQRSSSLYSAICLLFVWSKYDPEGPAVHFRRPRAEVNHRRRVFWCPAIERVAWRISQSRVHASRVRHMLRCQTDSVLIQDDKLIRHHYSL